MDLVPSLYNNLSELTDPLLDKQYMIWNSLYGTASLLDQQAFEWLSCLAKEAADLSTIDPKGVLAEAKERGYVVNPVRAQQERSAEWLSARFAESKGSESIFSLVLPGTHVSNGMIQTAVAGMGQVIDDRLIRSPVERCIITVNASPETSGASVNAVFEQLNRRLPELIGRHASSQWLLVLELHSADDLDFRCISVMRRKHRLPAIVKISLGLAPGDPAAEGESRISCIADMVASAARNGIRTHLFLGARDSTLDSITEAWIPDLIRRGCYKLGGLTDVFLVPTQIGKTPVLCRERLEVDIQALRSIVSRLAQRSRNQILKLAGGSVLRRIEFMRSSGGWLQPHTRSCRFSSRGWALDVLGNIYGCIEYARYGGAPLVGRVGPPLEIYEDQLHEWRALDVLSREACRRCSRAFTCTGGCPQDADEKADSRTPQECTATVDSVVELGLRALATQMMEVQSKKNRYWGPSEVNTR